MKRAPTLDRATARDLQDIHRTLARRTKTTRAEIKQAPTDGSGRFKALVSTFGPPPDTMGDVITPGAFADSILRLEVERAARGGPLLAVWWQHGYTDPRNVIGGIDSMGETKEGLVVDGHLDLSTERALVVYESMLAGRLREFSIAYGVVDWHEGVWEGKAVTHLDQLELLEVSVVAAGANVYTRVLDLKSRPEPTEAWRKSLNSINTRLDQLDGTSRTTATPNADKFVEQERRRRAAEDAERQRVAALAEVNADSARRQALNPDRSDLTFGRSGLTAVGETERETERRRVDTERRAMAAAEREASKQEAIDTDAARREHSRTDPNNFQW